MSCRLQSPRRLRAWLETWLRLLYFLAASVWLETTSPHCAAQAVIQADWIGASGTGGAGNWSSAADWDVGVVPNNGSSSYNVFIDNGLAANSAVTLDTTVTINNLTIDSGDSLTIANNQALTIAGNGTTGTITVNGTLNLGSTVNDTSLVVMASTVTLAGGGTLVLSNSVNNRIYATNSSFTLVNQATIQGAGLIGAGELTFTNQGTVNSSQSAGITLDPSGTTTNSGTMEASNGSTLTFAGGTVNNTGGTILAQTGSTVSLNSVTITAGTFSTVGSGVILDAAASTLSGPTLSSGSLLQIPNNGSLTVSGTFVNNGTVTLNSTANNTDLIAGSGGLTLSGGGAITMGSAANNRIYGATGSTLITNVNNTISGAGFIGVGQLELNNQGLINANVSGLSIVLSPSGTGFTNTGTMEATNGGTLQFGSGLYANAGGTVAAGANAVLLFSGASFSGGTINVGGTGALQLSANAGLSGETINTVSGSSLQNVSGANTLAGTVNIAAGSSLSVANNSTLTLPAGGTYANQGTIALNSTGNNTDLIVSGGTVTLSGGGIVALSNAITNRIYGASGSDTFVNANNTIQGAGVIGASQLTFINQGTVNATLPVGITINPSGGTTNSSTLEATNGSTLTFSGGSVNNTGGTILAGTGSTVSLSSVTITAGTFSTTGSGVILDAAASILASPTLSAGSLLQVPNNTTLTVSGTFVNNGTVTLNSTVNNTDFVAGSGGLTLGGGGAITLSSAVNNRIYGTTGSTLITNVNNTISGAGFIGVGQLELNNQGVINANDSGQSIVLSPSGTGFANTGTMEATNGGTLQFNGGPYSNTGGSVAAGANAVLSFSGANFSGGTISVGGTGSLQLSGNSSLSGETINTVSGSSLQNVSGANTLAGTVNIAAGSNLSVANNSTLTLPAGGTYANQGTIALNSTANNTDLIVSGGTVTLSGGGIVALSNAITNRIYGASGSDTFVNANNTIQGAGVIGASQLTFINQGTVNSNQSAGITLNPSGGTTNSGTLEASGGSTLTLSGSTVNNAGGSIQALNGSTVALSSVSINGGSLATAGTGVILDAAASTLTGPTLSAGSLLQVPNNATLTISGTFVNNGNVTLNSTVNNTDLVAVSGGLTLTGGGTVTLTDSPANRIYASSGSISIDNVDNTITGAGQIGLGQLTLTNTGTIIANGTNPLVLNLSNAFTNQGTLIGLGSGGLQFVSGNLTNGGTITIQSGSNVTVSGQYIQTSGVTNLSSATLNATSVAIQGGSFQGSGTVGTAVANNGLFHPVQSLSLTGNLTLGGSSTLLFDIGGSTAGSGYDTLSAPMVTLGGSLDLLFTNSYQNSILPGNTFTLITASGGLSGQFAGIANGARVGTMDGLGSFQVNYLSTSLTLSGFQQVPEPSTIALFALGALALFATRRTTARKPCGAILAALFGLLVAPRGAQAAPAQAPQQGLRLPGVRLHDPWILAEKSTGTYYLYSAAGPQVAGEGRTGTLFYKSKDLASWEGPYIAFVCPEDSWADPKERAWAPEVHAYRGKYYLFTTLHNPTKLLGAPRDGHPQMMRSTMIAASNSPEGPFVLLKKDAPVAPAAFMTLDGTFYVDPLGKPWMVYAHEWVQKVDGTIEALPLTEDLSAASGPPIYLFKGSDAPWINEQATPNARENHYVTDGPELYRTVDGHLLMLWSSYERNSYGGDGYVETVARSKSGELKGPWEQLPPLVKNDSGHGMLFRTFDGRLMLVLHQPFNGARGKIYEVNDRGDHLEIAKFREDLSGPPLGPQRGQKAS